MVIRYKVNDSHATIHRPERLDNKRAHAMLGSPRKGEIEEISWVVWVGAGRDENMKIRWGEWRVEY